MTKEYVQGTCKKAGNVGYRSYRDKSDKRLGYGVGIRSLGTCCNGPYVAWLQWTHAWQSLDITSATFGCERRLELVRALRVDASTLCDGVRVAD